jgi:hypothetical protein
LSQLAVEPQVGQKRASLTGNQALDLAAARAAQAAHLEHIGEVIVKHERQGQADRVVGVVPQRNSLVERVAVDKDRAHDVHGVLRQDEPLLHIQIRIGEVDDQ